jgi:putative ABC transport system permease protein
VVNYLARKRGRDMRRQRGQFLAVGITVAVGVLMFVATYDSYRNLGASYNETYRRLAFADMTITGGDPSLAGTLAGLDGVAAVQVRHTVDVPITIGDTTLRGRLVGMPVGSQPAVDAIGITSGTGLEHPDALEAVAEVHVARTFGLKPSDTFTLLTDGRRQVTVVGVASSPEYIWPAPSTQEIFADPKQFGVFFVPESLLAGLPASQVVRETLVLYDASADVAATDARVREAAVAAGATSILTQAEHPSNATLQLDVEGFGEMAVAFPVLFLTAAGLALYILLTRLVVIQRSTIGTLLASGVAPRAIRDHYLGYGLRLGGIAAVLGAAGGVATGAAMTALYTGLLDIPDTVVEIRPLTIAAGVLFGVLAGLLAAYVPARAAYRTAPGEAMRGVGPAVAGGRSLIERIIRPLARSSVRTRMTLRGIGRAKRRSLSTVVGVTLALTLVLAAGGMIDTIVDMIDQQFNQVALQDAAAITSQPVDEAVVAAVAGVPGVRRAEPVVTLPASVTGNGSTVSTILQGYQQDTVMHGWSDASMRLPATGALVATSLASKLGLGVGDSLTVGLPTLDRSIVLTVAGTVDEPMGLPIYATTSEIAAALGTAGVADPTAALADPSVTSVMAVFDPAVDRTAVLSGIEHLPPVVAVSDARSLYNLVDQFLGLFYAFTGIMLLFGGLMAFALMFNTISVNVAERSTEFATLKASGMSDRTVAGMIAGENLLLTAIGIVPGLVLGTIAAAEMLQSFNNDSFHFGLVIAPLTYAVAIVGMLAVAVLSMVPGIRSIRHLDIGAVVRERAI